MAHDNRMLEKILTNKTYKVPNYKKNKVNGSPKVVVPESMVLMHELQDNNKKITELKNRNKAIRKLLVGQKIIKGDYYNKPIYLYALQLEGGYYYIGMSRNPEKRFKKHSGRKGAMWTKLHRPIEIVETRNTNLTDDAEAALLENEMTFEYAKKYGADLVRGGGYCQTKPKWPKHLFEPDLSWIE